MDITDTGMGFTSASTTPPGGVSATAGAVGSCGGAFLSTGLGFDLAFGFVLVSGAGVQTGIALLAVLGGDVSWLVGGGVCGGGKRIACSGS
jgi:hypothetical protein